MSGNKFVEKELKFLGDYVNIEEHNRRIKIYNCKNMDKKMVKTLMEIGKAKNCDKIIFYLRDNEVELIKEFDAIREGVIKGFFNGINANIFSIFLNGDRNNIDNKTVEILNIVENSVKKNLDITLDDSYTLDYPDEDDAKDLAELYDKVFETYPTPMNKESFIKEMMNDDVHFSVVRYKDEIVSACSADVFTKFNSAEMTDCATLPEHRGKKLVSLQFEHLINKMKKKKVKTLFSYTRSKSIAMNMINYKFNFKYGGSMAKNSNISGGLEDMNIWYKSI